MIIEPPIAVYMESVDFGRDVNIYFVRRGSTGATMLASIDNDTRLFRWEEVEEAVAYPQPTLTVPLFLLEALRGAIEQHSGVRTTDWEARYEELKDRLTHVETKRDELIERLTNRALREG